MNKSNRELEAAEEEAEAEIVFASSSTGKSREKDQSAAVPEPLPRPKTLGFNLEQTAGAMSSSDYSVPRTPYSDADVLTFFKYLGGSGENLQLSPERGKMDTMRKLSCEGASGGTADASLRQGVKESEHNRFLSEKTMETMEIELPVIVPRCRNEPDADVET